MEEERKVWDLGVKESAFEGVLMDIAKTFIGLIAGFITMVGIIILVITVPVWILPFILYRQIKKRHFISL